MSVQFIVLVTAMATVYPCVVCKTNVRPKQEALQCDNCNRWQHRTCQKEITQKVYWQVVHEKVVLESWHCKDCTTPSEPMQVDEPSILLSPPSGESTRVSDQLDGSYRTEDLSAPYGPPPDREDELQEEDGSYRTEDLSAPYGPPPDREDELQEDEDSLPDFSHDSIAPVVEIQERSCQHPADEMMETDPDTTQTHRMTYTIVAESSQRGGDMLFSSIGYSYTEKKREGGKVYWRCSKRYKKNVDCRATMIQSGETFEPGRHDHNHTPELGTTLKAQVGVEIRSKAPQQIFDVASNLVDDVLLEAGDRPGMPSQAALLRRVNRAKAKMRPAEPQDLDFELADEYTPDDFLIGDIEVLWGRNQEKARHLIFATPYQLKLLSEARRLYLDGTFKVVREPFYQLFSIHAFLRSGDDIKQVPLAFALMSRRKKADYQAVLAHIKASLPTRAEMVECVLDFEMGMWQALPLAFPDVQIKGCVFHWCQTVWKKAQKLGLQVSYSEDEQVHRWLRRLLALPFLPAEAIVPAFEALYETSRGALTELARYVQSTWIESSVWSPRRWSVYKQSVRTNNDVEGWHTRLNLKAKKSALPLYLLVDLLHREARLVRVQARQVCEGELRRYQRTTYRNLQGSLFRAWQKFANGEKSAKDLLVTCAKIYGPVVRYVSEE
ncbi:uncharacterized protein [Branchiostoma lanceolatum]|uniref:uncharacterized protein n=1 Tax=Branchiostoma lanceolatum TaxID=7740 RepID=UPI003456CEE3